MKEVKIFYLQSHLHYITTVQNFWYTRLGLSPIEPSSKSPAFVRKVLKLSCCTWVLIGITDSSCSNNFSLFIRLASTVLNQHCCSIVLLNDVGVWVSLRMETAIQMEFIFVFKHFIVFNYGYANRTEKLAQLTFFIQFCNAFR